MHALKSAAVSAIDGMAEDLNKLSQKIWSKPELAFQEHSAHSLLTDFLEKQGFEVSKSTPLETSFISRYKNPSSNATGNNFPRVGVMCEFDALPEIGHACGHNLIAEAGIAAAIGVKAALQYDPNMQGEIVVFGTPAEESGGGKVKMIKAGCFSQVDVCMMVHPYAHDLPDPIVLAEMDGKIVFSGKPAHAAAAPWDGVNALDAAVTFYVSMSMIRQQQLPTNRIQCIFKDGGEKTNIIPRRSELACVVRGITSDDAIEISNKLTACAQGAASATGCTVDIWWGVECMYQNLISNPVLLKLYMDNARQLGMKFDMEVSKNWASTDAGNVSHVVPTIQPCYKVEANGNLHTKEFQEAAGLQKSQLPTLNCGKAMACAAVDMYMNPTLVEQAKLQFKLNCAAK